MPDKGFKSINVPKKLHKRLNRERKNLSYSRFIKKSLDEVERLREEISTLRENNGHLAPQPQDHESLDGDRFHCEILCRKFRGCTLNAMFELDEIKARNCFRPNYPDYCNYMLWETRYQRHGDPEHPYPKCLDPRPAVAIAKDRIICNPQICWQCMKIKKRLKEQKIMKKALRDPYAGEPRIDWGKSDAPPDFYGRY
ncbi:hypothetical protein GTO27_08080 [Candidatus Bathyarchaeota archaeon]|nr:hypothetical protein [Nitrososphaeria archaeon]NIO37647.1 hypothetical protein [Candidatus Bathyarchaeota archaeon]